MPKFIEITKQALPQALYTASQTRQLDTLAIQTLGIRGYELMQKAAASFWEWVLFRWPRVKTLTVICGGGNNGGDGYEIASLAREKGIHVQLIAVTPPESLSGAAMEAQQGFILAGGHICRWSDTLVFSGELIIDALLGTGFSGSLRGDTVPVIKKMNAARQDVISVDIPSGLNADTGAADLCTQAVATLTFIGVNAGLMTAKGPDACGSLWLCTLDISETVFAQVPPLASTVGYRGFRQSEQGFRSRQQDTHKGCYGHVLIIGGDHGMGGAVMLAAQAVLRAGVGRATVVTRPEHVTAMMTRSPEVMALGIDDVSHHRTQIDELIERPSLIAIGPGLGLGNWGQSLLQCVLSRAKVPVVFDADALSLLARISSEGKLSALLAGRKSKTWVMTPHPGEAASLLNLSSAEVQVKRFEVVQLISQRFDCFCVLKGCGSLVASPSGTIHLCVDGNPGMATAGMGDLLTGVLAGVLAQRSDIVVGNNLLSSVAFGACIHSRAGDIVALESGPRGLNASDLLPVIRQLVN